MTEVLVTDHRTASRRAKSLAEAARDLAKTMAVYLAVAFMSGFSYALCSIALHGGVFARLWLASVTPIGLFLIARSIWRVCRQHLAQ